VGGGGLTFERLQDCSVEKVGIEKGIEKGRKEGLEKGLEKGLEEGVTESVKKIMHRFPQFSDTEIADIFQLPLQRVNAIRAELEA